MIRVGYDVTSLALSPYGGIARVCYHTLTEALKHDRVEPVGFYRSGKPGRDLENLPLVRSRTISPERFRKFDIAHGLCHRLPGLRAKRFVYTLHDVWSLYPNRYQPPHFQKKVAARMKRDLTRSDCIISDSNTTRDNLLKLELVPAEKVYVAHLGVHATAPVSGDATTQLSPVLSDQKYILCVGRMEYRKNLPHIIEAIRNLPKIHLVIVGEPGFGYDETVKPALDSFDNDRLHLFDRLPRDLVADLYRHAVALLLPSWEEGFGMPILEAMAHGCPVVTSNCSASAEIGGDAAVLVDPSSPAESAEAVERLIDDPEHRSRLIKAGYERAAGFTWERYFCRLFTIYTDGV